MVLVLIALKIFLEAAGFEVPISHFLGVLVAWRVVAVVWTLWHRRSAARRVNGGNDSDTPGQQDHEDVARSPSARRLLLGSGAARADDSLTPA